MSLERGDWMDRYISVSDIGTWHCMRGRERD